MIKCPGIGMVGGIVVAAVFVVGCDGGVRVRGRVVDASGNPIPEAQIHLENGPSARRFSDRVTPDGCFHVIHVVAPGRYDYNLHVVAPGFAVADGVVRTIEDNYALVILRRLGEAKQSSIRVSLGAWPEGAAEPACGR